MNIDRNINPSYKTGSPTDIIPVPRLRKSLALMTLKQARRVVVAMMGATVILIGAVLLFIPGPGIVVMVAGLAILATEFLWARRWLNYLKVRGVAAANHLRKRNGADEVAEAPHRPIGTVLPADPCAEDPLICPPGQASARPRTIDRAAPNKPC